MIEVHDSHIKLEERKCGDYTLSGRSDLRDQPPQAESEIKSAKSPSRELELLCVKKHCHVHTGPQCQSPFPFISVLRGLWH